MSKWSKNEAIKYQVDLMEKEIVYFQGLKRSKARKSYLRLLMSCKNKCGLDEPIYLKRR
ncbi:MAG: hypothetical protein P8X91_01775 [Candidatus Bathyarchaeota archaeon]|jgi:hypothetical protein